MNFLDSSPKKYKISGNANFSLEVTIQGQMPYHTAVISITTHTKGNRKDLIGSNYKWFRISDSTTYYLNEMVSNTYVISPVDIGYKLHVEITPKEEGYDGVATVDFGPIKLDSMIRNTLEGILSVGGSSFPATLINEGLNKMNSDINILLTNDTIRIVRNYDQESLKFCYSSQNPQIEIASRDLTLITFAFIDPIQETKLSGLIKDKRLSLRMSSRISRDLLLLAIKSFSIKSYLINSKIIASLENPSNSDPTKLFKEKDNDHPLMGDLYLEVNLVKQENSMLLEQNKILKNEKEAYSNQIKNLEEEIIETIDTYTKLITDLKENSGDSKLDENLLEITKRELFTKKRRTFELNEIESNELTSIKKTLFKDEKDNEISELQNKNANLTIEINFLKEELLKLKPQKNSNANFQDLSIKLEIMTKENLSLKQTQQKYYELLSKYRELDETYSALSKSRTHDTPTTSKCESLEKELFQEKENTKKLSEELKLLALQFNAFRKNAGSQNFYSGDSESELSTINKQLTRKIESLQKELESKGNSLIIEQLTKTNTKFMYENQKLMEELKRKNDEILQGGGSGRGDGALFVENQELKRRIRVLEEEKDKLLVEYSRIKKF